MHSQNWKPLILPSADPIRTTRKDGRIDVSVDILAYLAARPAKVKPHQDVAFIRYNEGIVTAKLPAQLVKDSTEPEERRQLARDLSRLFALPGYPDRLPYAVRAFERIVNLRAGAVYLSAHLQPLMIDLAARLAPLLAAWIPPELKEQDVVSRIAGGEGLGPYNDWAASEEGRRVLTRYDPSVNTIDFAL